VRRAAVLLALGLAACPAGPATRDGGAPITPPSPGVAYEACDSLCLRETDCQVAYPDDGYCPGGFRCSARFSCLADAGVHD
jgi:hypothetical protein